MSEERFDRLESQLSQVIQGMGIMQQGITVMQQNMTVMQQDITNIKQVVSETRTDVAALSSRLDRSPRILYGSRFGMLSKTIVR
jgi:FtsZ-binding cell division protein ZapB